MTAPPDASYADVLWAAFNHLANNFKPNHPELAAQIVFDNDAVATVWEILKHWHAEKEASIPLQIGNA